MATKETSAPSEEKEYFCEYCGRSIGICVKKPMREDRVCGDCEPEARRDYQAQYEEEVEALYNRYWR